MDRRPLFVHQKAALDYALAKPHPALFMEMRLGKTLVAIRAIRARELYPCLVVAPLSVLTAWEDELGREGYGPADVRVLRRKQDLLDGSRWNLCHYELLRMRPDLAQRQWGAVVLDESTRIKNPKAQTTKLCLAGFRDVESRFLLSGLPSPESPLEFFTQFTFQTGAFLGCRNYWSFRRRFFQQYGFDWVPRPDARARIKEEVRKRAFCLTRKQAGIGSQKVYEVRTVEPSKEQLKLTKQVVADYQLFDEETKWMPVVQTWLAQLAGGFAKEQQVGDGKFKELLALLKGELVQEQAIVFFRFNRELKEAERLLREAGISVGTMLGETTVEDRAVLGRAFRAGTIRVALLQIKVARFGIDLSAASTAIYFSNSYSLEDRLQSEDRIVHPSKKEPLLYIDLVTKQSLDPIVVRALRDKKSDAQYFSSRLLSDFVEWARANNPKH